MLSQSGEEAVQALATQVAGALGWNCFTRVRGAAETEGVEARFRVEKVKAISSSLEKVEMERKNGK